MNATLTDLQDSYTARLNVASWTATGRQDKIDAATVKLERLISRRARNYPKAVRSQVIDELRNPADCFKMIRSMNV